MYLRDLIDELIDELEANGNHKVLIEYDTDFNNEVEGVRVESFFKGGQITYYITNNL